MLVTDLLAGLNYRIVQGSDRKEITGLAWDSREVKPQDLFICVVNRRVDRHEFAGQAVAAGATVLIIEHDITPVPPAITVIQVEHTKAVLALIASRFYGDPSQAFNLIGITGTNGKTSTTSFIAQILTWAGRSTGTIGTLPTSIAGQPSQVAKYNPTTPDSLELQAIFNEMRCAGVTDVAMEVTSSALAGHRVDYCHFDIGVFTNLSHDHLEEHQTMENYKQAKFRLFDRCRHGLINADDPVADELKARAGCEILLTYGIDKEADFRATNLHYDAHGVEFTLVFGEIIRGVRLAIPGRFSIYNCLAAIGACYLSGLSLERIIQGIAAIHGVPGRFETIPTPQDSLIIVDYAHTPDGLQNILTTARQITQRRLITVFGCGGERDRTKRPIMGKLAGELSDFVILTSDNPREEDPEQILTEVKTGIRQTACRYLKCPDRKTAIIQALKRAQPGDTVVLAGKGHETYQILKDRTIHFDDKEIVREYFAE